MIQKFFIFVLFLILIFSQRNIDIYRDKYLGQLNLAYQPGNMMNVALIAGFRGIAADILMIQIDSLNHQGKWYKIIPLINLVVYLQPNFIQAWRLGAWHLSFNLFAYTDDPEKKQYWVDQGLQFIRKGIPLNPDTWELNFELGWILYHKREDYLQAAQAFANSVKIHSAPQYVFHMLAHSYEKAGDYQKCYEVWDYLFQNPKSNPKLSRVVKRHRERIHQLIMVHSGQMGLVQPFDE